MTQKKSALTFCASALSHLAILCVRMSLLCEMRPMPLPQELFLPACLRGWSCRSSSFLRSRCCPDTFLLRNKGALKLGSCPCQDLFQLSNPHTLYLVCLVSRIRLHDCFYPLVKLVYPLLQLLIALTDLLQHVNFVLAHVTRTCLKHFLGRVVASLVADSINIFQGEPR